MRSTGFLGRGDISVNAGHWPQNRGLPLGCKASLLAFCEAMPQTTQ